MALYSPYKAVGYVTDGTAYCINRLGEDTFLTTSIGKAFQVYRFDRLTVCLVSRPAPGKITCLQSFGHETFCAVGNDIVVYNRTQIVRTYRFHLSPIVGLLMIGRNLISYDQSNHIKVIDTKVRKVVAEMTSLQPGTITSIMHPATYVNKIVIGYSNGQMELWNIQKQAIIYTFASHVAHLNGTSSSSSSSSESNFVNPFGDDNDEDDGVGDDGDAGSSYAVTSIEQSPACDVLGVGFSNGEVLLLNAKLDVVLFSFHQDGGAVTSISFRSDASSDKFPFMVSSSGDGRLHIWNLGNKTDGGKMERKLESSLDEAHTACVSRVHFLYGEPVMVSAAADNTLKVWIFDSPDGSARLLRSREGHSGWPVRIRYYGGSTNASIRDNSDATSCEIVSAGSDGTLRLFNTAVEVQNREFSQNTLLKKLGMRRRNERLPVVSGFDFSETRQRDWGDMVTIHKNHANAYLWRFRNRTVTEMILRQPSWPKNEKMYAVERSTHATAVAMSPCGNYCAVGSRGGVIYLYNVQSGIPRGAFPSSKGETIKEGLLKQRQAVPGNVYHQQKSVVEEGKGAETNSLKVKNPLLNAPNQSEDVKAPEGHTQAVTGIFIEIANAVMVTCGLDSRVIFWDFNHRTVLHKAALKSPVTMMQGFQDGGFVAVASQDRVVRVYDIHTFKLSRRFAGHTREVSDVAFTPDGRRLLTSSMDSTLRVWDMPTGRCLSWLSFESPVLSMAMSHSGEFLSLSMVDKEGIFMYVDRSLYETVHFWREPISPVSVADSLVQVEKGGGDEDGDGDGDGADAVGNPESEEGAGEVIVPVQAQVATGLARESASQRGARAVTMAAVPRAYWTSLFNLEAIKARNRATAAPEAPKQAPFFLPTVVRGGSTPSFPTPAEFALMMKQPQPSESVEGVSGGKKRKETETGESGKKQKKEVGNDKEDDDAKVLADLAAMSGAWDDGDGDGDWGAEGVSPDGQSEGGPEGEGEPERDGEGLLARIRAGSEVSVDTGFILDRKPMSRIINRKTALPRCKLVVFLLREYPGGVPAPVAAPGNDAFFAEEAAAQDLEVDSEADTDGPILEYLKHLPPPAVDIELRALCAHEEDTEGLSLLRCLLDWLARKLKTGMNFEILQAYLHRTLTIYAELVLKQPQLGREVEVVRRIHAESSGRFRELVQSNLCLLKMLAGLPPT